jgi:hypothetical protein
MSTLKEDFPDEILQVTKFRLLAAPQEVVNWPYKYVNRAFSMPFYRTQQGQPLAGWSYRVVTTRRFFTDQSARIYFRIKDLRQSFIFSSTSPAVAEAMRIWPVGAILVLETFPGRTALGVDASPTTIDCMRKFKPALARFQLNTIFAGEWRYQRFNADGKVGTMPAGAGACHQCHGAAFSLTGDLVFTVFSKDVQKIGSGQQRF